MGAAAAGWDAFHGMGETLAHGTGWRDLSEASPSPASNSPRVSPAAAASAGWGPARELNVSVLWERSQGINITLRKTQSLQ